MNPRVRTVIAFDYGLRQIGVAVGNSLLRSARALAIIRAKDGIPDWPSLERLLREWQPDLLVVGEPLNMDGSDSEMGERARKFARRLHGRTGLPVEMADERLSSFEAKQLSRERGHDGDYKRRPVDSEAAALVLESWLNNVPESPGN